MTTTNRLWHLAIALGLAVLAVAMTTFYVTNYKRHVQRGEKNVSVLVAGKDIPADTPGSEISSGHLLRLQTVARRAVVPGAISSPGQIANLVTTHPVFAGEQVTMHHFGTSAERGIRAQIHGNRRAFQLPGDANQLLAGTLHAGDHVDVVASWAYPESGQHHVSRVVLRNLLVLRAPAAPEHGSGLNAGNQNFSAQLAVTDGQSQKLQWLAANASWRLELRPPVRAADSPGSVDTAGTLVADGIRRASLESQLSAPLTGAQR